MSRIKWHGAIVMAAAALLMAAPASAYEVVAGVVVDVHQDIRDVLPNDFHIEGLICASGGAQPVVINTLNGPFTNFNYTLVQLNPGVPGDCWWWFTADWWLPAGTPGFPYCTMIQLGLLFEIGDENTIIDLSGWWTLDGERVGDVIGDLQNEGAAPALGFDVGGTADGLIARIGNGVFPPIGPAPDPTPVPQPIPVEIVDLDLISMSPDELPEGWFNELYEGGAQNDWEWIAVADKEGREVSPDNPTEMPPDSFFDIFFDIDLEQGQFTPAIPVVVDPGDILIIRSRRMFINNSGEPEVNDGLWEWHIHGAQDAEACCFPDGGCMDLTPDECVALGGFPMGVGTKCDTVVCPQIEPEACCMPSGDCVVLMPSDCEAEGGVRMGVPNCDDIDCPEPGDYRFEFSLDIGSDTELSDPFMDGDEGFDPGDVYWWQGPAVNPPGRDGFKDDMFIFNYDPRPDPPDPGSVTRVPVGEENPELYYEYFDLDGHDQLDVDILEQEWFHVTHVLDTPIPYFDSFCIHKIDFLMISYDDDMGPGWTMGDVPVTAPSPAGVSSYGTTASRDEVVGLNILSGGPVPYPIQSIYPIADERTVHVSLAPNPDDSEADDDDVDSLDIVHSQDECPYWYFSPDSEAHLGLDPGGVYQVVVGGFPVQIIDEMHLGIPEETDIDAFEFIWLQNPEEPDGTLYLALVYSVDDDDPITGWDESGGMLPNVLYASFMTGWSFQVTSEDQIRDDIDALTCWDHPLEPQPQTGACCLDDCVCNIMLEGDCLANGGVWNGIGSDCGDLNADGIADVCFTRPGDLNCDGKINLSDLAQLLAHYGTASGAFFRDGDLDGDGDVDLADLAAMLAVYGT